MQGHAGLNRAVDGDTVVLELLPEDEWVAPSDIVLEDLEDDPGNFLSSVGINWYCYLLRLYKLIRFLFFCPQGDILDDEAKMEKEKLKAKKIQREPTGQVVGIIRRKWRQYCGILQPSQDKNVGILIADTYTIF